MNLYIRTIFMPEEEPDRIPTIKLRTSPLLELMKELIIQYPDVDLDLIDKVVIESKCIPEVALRLISDHIDRRRLQLHNGRSQSFDAWVDRFGIHSSMPNAEIKVFRLP